MIHSRFSHYENDLFARIRGAHAPRVLVAAPRRDELA